MFAPKITLTREQLHEKVWSTPMQKLAAEFGFSDVGLAKLCRRHQVPVPPRGYWARLQAGQKVARTSLKPPTQPGLATIEIYPHERRERDADAAAQEIPTIIVADDRPIAHPIALRIEKSICGSKASRTGLLLPRHGMSVPIQVSAEQLPRALRICDALLAAAEQAGHRLTWAKPYSAPLTVTLLDEPLSFLISEVLEGTEHQPTAEDGLHKKRDPWWRPEKWDYRPTGRLRLSIESGKNLGLRRSWSDGKRNRVEGFLGHFLVSLTVVAKALKRQREEQAQREPEWAEERKRREEMAARRAEYERRAKLVEGLVGSWDRSHSLRAFALKLSLAAGQPTVAEEQKQDLLTMAEWVIRHADFVDPFSDVARMIGQFKAPPWSY